MGSKAEIETLEKGSHYNPNNRLKTHDRRLDPALAQSVELWYEWPDKTVPAKKVADYFTIVATMKYL